MAHPIMSAEHLREISRAKLRTRKVRRAARVAAISGWTMVFFACTTALGVLFGDWTSAVLAPLLLVIALNELRGGRMLGRFEERGARVLGWNQVALAVLIVVYAGWSLYAATHNPALQAALGGTGDAQTDAMLRSLTDMATYGLYGGLAIFGVLGPGLTSWYYFARARHVRAAVKGTPAWVLEMMRAVGG